MSYGAVESLSTLGLSGWAINLQRPETSPLVGIWLDNELIGAAVASDLRADVKNAGYSLTGRCGFRFVFPRPIAQERLSTLSVRLENGQALPHVGSTPFDVFDLLFQGSYGRDTSIPMSAFLSTHYLRHNARRLEHLASLGLPLSGRKVVEFGAGVGDHTSFYLDRQCEILATDARPSNLDLMRMRLMHHPGIDRLRTECLNVEEPFDLVEQFDIVHCYGLLYHVASAKDALAQMARHCKELFLLETKTDPGPSADESYGRESPDEVYHSFSGTNFRPTRQWLHAAMKTHFPFVYWPVTQPSHEEFPIDFGNVTSVPDGWPRAVLIGSRQALANDLLLEAPPPTYAPSF